MKLTGVFAIRHQLHGVLLGHLYDSRADAEKAAASYKGDPKPEWMASEDWWGVKVADIDEMTAPAPQRDPSAPVGASVGLPQMKVSAIAYIETKTGA